MSEDGTRANAAPVAILLLEDSPVDAELLTHRLAIDGVDARIERVDNEEAFRERLAQPWDLVLADFALPGFTGAQALKIVRERDADLPFVFVSGVLGEEHAVDMVRRGATDYVLKQRIDRLPFVVRRALHEARERRSRLAAEAALRATETSYAMLVEALRDYAVMTLDTDGRIRSWSPASERIFGYPAAAAIGASGAMLHDPSMADPAGFRQELEDARLRGSSSDDQWLTRSDGSRFFGSGVTTAMRDEDGRLLGFSKIVRDMTDARLAAEALQAAKEQAEAASRAKDRFLAILSHELRTPLAPVLLGLHLIERQAELPEAVSDTLKVIRRNVTLEIRLIDDLLDLTRISHDKLEIELAAIDLRSVLDGVVQLCRHEIDDKQLRFEVTVDAHDTHVVGDSARLHQVLWNVLRNAVKFTAEHGVVSVVVSNPDATSVQVAIRDNGIGIDPEVLQTIFSAFDQGPEAIGRRYGGLGLGLPIARALARRHGGDLVAGSDGPGRGATFTFRMPLAQPGTTAAGRSAAVSADRRRPNRRRVLLVEDHEDTRRITEHLLRVAGHEVTAVSTVAQAEQVSADARFDLLVSDVGLPDGSGLDVIRKFRRHSTAPAIAVSGWGQDADVQRCLSAGFSTHLTKPVDEQRLLSALARACGDGPDAEHPRGPDKPRR